MRWSLDARTPLRLADAASTPADAVVLAEDGAPLPDRPALVERFAAPPPGAHPIGCACCQPRNPVAIALDRLFLARTRGQAPWFSEIWVVLRTGDGANAIEAALQTDSVTQARFRKA
ncbi:hypothetical protein [Pseudoroseomonas cervicalis]|uniref:hypothetical protein n=1 Tax=Teichococcus cervicalis TaxID=204525 RepID=UPI00277DCDF7|nr:hypothetical protein [Pseudoroseomonas cervicalis]MDQ1081127.1 hypothetical protein [Pseudoroseomonas cervicalis]